MIKYDRKGYKARPRQLLLTQSAVVLVEDSRIKQRIDYGNLTGVDGDGGRWWMVLDWGKMEVQNPEPASFCVSFLTWVLSGPENNPVSFPESS